MPGRIRGHMPAGPDCRDKLTRCLENHDEPRAASEISCARHQPAAIITSLSPRGLRFKASSRELGCECRPSLSRPFPDPRSNRCNAERSSLWIIAMVQRTARAGPSKGPEIRIEWQRNAAAKRSTPARTREKSAIGSGNSWRSTPKSRKIRLLADPK